MFMKAGYRLFCLENSCSSWRIKFTCAVETASEDSIIVGIYKLVALKQFYIVSGSYCGITYTVKHAKQLFMERAYFYYYILSHFWLSFLMAFNASACAMWPFSAQILTVHELWHTVTYSVKNQSHDVSISKYVYCSKLE